MAFKFKFDLGADTTIINEATYGKLQKPKLRPVTSKIDSPGKNVDSSWVK